jgi:molybdenum cofactor cytidylyltransferase
MGRPKALLPLGSGATDTFFDRITRTLLDAGIDEVVVVVGADARAIREQARPLPGVRIVDNPDYERGQLTSLLAGLSAFEHQEPEALLVTLIDVPLVSAATVRAVVGMWRNHRAEIVRPASRGRHGHPVIFDRSLFGELRHADPAQGAKPVVRAHAANILDVDVDDEGAFIDIDTPEEYERVRGRS